MGDRCYMLLEFFTDDLPAFEEYGLDRGELHDEWRTADGRAVMQAEYSQVNYGATSAREELAKKGLTFWGYHGEGCEYGAMRFYAVDGQLHELDCTNDGANIIVHLDDDTGEVNARSIEKAKAFWKAERKTREQLTPEHAPKPAPSG